MKRLPPYLRYCLSFSLVLPFLLAFDEKTQRPPRLCGCYSLVPPPRNDDSFQSSPAVCLRSGTLVMMVYASPTTLGPVLDSVAACSSWLRYICVFTISRVPRATSVPTSYSDLLVSVHFSRFSLLIRPRHHDAQNILGRSSFSRHFLPFFLPPAPPRIFSEKRQAKRA